MFWLVVGLGVDSNYAAKEIDNITCGNWENNSFSNIAVKDERLFDYLISMDKTAVWEGRAPIAIRKAREGRRQREVAWVSSFISIVIRMNGSVHIRV